MLAIGLIGLPGTASAIGNPSSPTHTALSGGPRLRPKESIGSDEGEGYSLPPEPGSRPRNTSGLMQLLQKIKLLVEELIIAS
jgi:hypothetical protein